MNCKHCNTENPEDAVFCKECGKRLDGKSVCPACGKLIPPETVFCIYCGKRADGKTVCAECGTAHEGAFCPACGAAARNKTRKTPPARHPADGDADGTLPLWKKIVDICATSMALAGVLCSLLFVFFIGFGLSGSPAFNSAMGSLGLNGVQVSDLYYFFGKGYEEVSNALNGLQSYTPLYEASLYLPVVFGTVISAGVLIAVPVLSIIAAVKLIQKLTGKEGKGAEKLAFASYFTFVAGATALLALQHVSLSVMQTTSESFPSITVSVQGGVAFNAATLSGLTLGGIFISLFAACKIALNGKALVSAPVLVKTCISLGSVVLLAIAWTFAGQSAGGFSQTQSGANMSASLSFPMIMQLLGDAGKTTDNGNLINAFAFSCCAYALQLALIVLLAATTTKCCTVLCEEKRNSALGLSIGTAAVAIVFLIFSVLAGTFSATALFSDPLPAGMAVFYTGTIAALVFSVLNLVANIVMTVVGKTLSGAQTED